MTDDQRAARREYQRAWRAAMTDAQRVAARARYYAKKTTKKA